MEKQCTNYIQTESLIKSWKELLAIKESLELEIRTFETIDTDVENEYIYTKTIGNREISDRSHSGKISDTTGNLALNYLTSMNDDYQTALDTIKEECFLIELINSKLTVGYNNLSPIHQLIIKSYYLDNKTWTEVLEDLIKEKHFYSKREAQYRRREGIYKIQKISRITEEAYEKVMRLVNVV